MSQDKRRDTRLAFFKPPVPPAAKSADERLREAREKAKDYQSKEVIPELANAKDMDEDKPDTLEEWADVVTQRIEEAMRRGDFDNLPGRGKPLQLKREPFVPEDQQMAFKLLQNNDLTPAWIGNRRETLTGIETWREGMLRVANEARTAWQNASSDQHRQKVAETWARWLTRWEGELAEINRRINTLNLMQPVVHLEIFKLRLDDELRRAGVGRVLG